MPVLSDLADEELFALYKSTGSNDYFEIIYNRHACRVRRYLEKLMPQRQGVAHHGYIDDLVQQVFTNLIGHELFTKSTLLNFLLENAKRRCWSLIRRLTATKRFKNMPDAEVNESDRITHVTPFNELSRKETTTTLREMVSRLPETEQRVILLFLDGRSKQGIGRDLAMSPRSFITCFDRAVRLLRKMAPDGLELALA